MPTYVGKVLCLDKNMSNSDHIFVALKSSGKKVLFKIQDLLNNFNHFKLCILTETKFAATQKTLVQWTVLAIGLVLDTTTVQFLKSADIC